MPEFAKYEITRIPDPNGDDVMYIGHRYEKSKKERIKTRDALSFFYSPNSIADVEPLWEFSHIEETRKNIEIGELITKEIYFTINEDLDP